MKKTVFGLLTSISLVYAFDLSKILPTEMIMMDEFDDEEIFVQEPVSTQNEPVYTTEINTQYNPNDMIQNADNTTSIFEESISYVEEPDLSIFSNNSQVKVALLVPKKVIGQYANSVANSIISYFIFKNKKFQLEVFDCATEHEKSIQLALEKIKYQGYQFIIAPMTATGANIIAAYEQDALVYIPTVHKMDAMIESSNILYGGIDYNAQIDTLLQYSEEKIAIFSDESKLSGRLTDVISQQKFDSVVYNKKIKNIKANISYLFRKNHKLTNSSIFLNMPVVKSSLVASQLSRYSVNMKNILSTQVNYSPMLLTLTQFQDREKFYVANSIGEIPVRLRDINSLLGENINYNWIDYSTTVGLDYVYATYHGRGSNRTFSEEIYENQTVYDITILKAMKDSFKVVDIQVQ